MSDRPLPGISELTSLFSDRTARLQNVRPGPFARFRTSGMTTLNRRPSECEGRGGASGKLYEGRSQKKLPARISFSSRPTEMNASCSELPLICSAARRFAQRFRFPRSAVRRFHSRRSLSSETGSGRVPTMVLSETRSGLSDTGKYHLKWTVRRPIAPTHSLHNLFTQSGGMSTICGQSMIVP